MPGDRPGAIIPGMPKRSRKQRLPDPNLAAIAILERVTGEVIVPKPAPPPAKEKDPAAVALGRKGGLKGGKARAAAMTKAQRVASAKKAACVRTYVIRFATAFAWPALSCFAVATV